MAKKNSTKTATKEAQSASEPRVAVINHWTGINIEEAPATWSPLDTDHNTSDLADTYLMVQNNVVTTSSLSLETRADAKVLVTAPAGVNFNGVCALYHQYLIAAFDDRSIRVADTTTGNWINTIFPASRASSITPHAPSEYIQSINVFASTVVAFNVDCQIITGKISENSNVSLTGDQTSEITFGQMYLPTPVSDPIPENGSWDTNWKLYGDLKTSSPAIYDDDGNLVQEAIPEVCRFEWCFCYTTKYGSTKPSNWQSLMLNMAPQEWSGNAYFEAWMIVSPAFQSLAESGVITGVDLYYRIDENLNPNFMGHAGIVKWPTEWQDDYTPRWSFKWLGAMQDTSAWINTPMYIPTENTSGGPRARFMNTHDGRAYFWGDNNGAATDYGISASGGGMQLLGPDDQPDTADVYTPYRLWIGGNPGAELSVARGLGGGFVDVDPGSGTEVRGTAKFKTYNGASIVTIMCSNPNTHKVRRFNLLETNTTLTNEVASKSYMTEEVANVVGCNSRYGFGVFADGLYSISRYGLALTTQAMESNNQLRTQYVSDAIKPVFTDRISERLNNAHMVCIDDVIYIALAETSHDTGVQALDNVLLCYDIDKKSWYTFTNVNPYKDAVRHIFNYDSVKTQEGLGVLTDTRLILYPTTGIQDPEQVKHDVLIETGELAGRQPISGTIYLSQLEFRFDYYYGDIEILVEGVDYYGRPFKVRKTCSQTDVRREWQEWVRVDMYVESFRIRIKGKARFRMSHILMKAYSQSSKINLVYGFDDQVSYKTRAGYNWEIHHYLDDYNNLRQAIVT